MVSAVLLEREQEEQVAQEVAHLLPENKVTVEGGKQLVGYEIDVEIAPEVNVTVDGWRQVVG